MKEWFKYEFGYVNIDSENLYLTNSGNWSETKNLSEKTKEISKKNDNRSSSVLGFLIVVFLIFVFMIYKNMVSGKVGLTLIGTTIVGGYKLYEYLKTEIGAKFRIPLSKIYEIKLSELNAEIYFEDGEEKKDNYKLMRIDEKGYGILENLKNTMHNSRL
jgi:hypothetical protein